MKRTYLILSVISLLIYSCSSNENKTPEITQDENPVDTVHVDTAVGVTPLLGEFAKIMIGTNKYEETVKFYSILGWEIEEIGTEPWKWTAMYDGSMSILINEDTMNYMGLAYHSDDAKNVYKTLKDGKIDPAMEITSENGEAWFNVYFSPDSLGYSVINKAHAPKDDIQVADIIFNPNNSYAFPNKKAGVFQEYAISVENVDSSLNYYLNIGFESEGVHAEGVPYKYAICYDGQMTIGLHETKGMWDGQLFTYSGHGINENDSLVAELKAQGYENIEALEFGGQVIPGNYLIPDPANNTFFLTTDFSGMQKK